MARSRWNRWENPIKYAGWAVSIGGAAIAPLHLTAGMIMVLVGWWAVHTAESIGRTVDVRELRQAGTVLLEENRILRAALRSLSEGEDAAAPPHVPMSN